MPGTYRGNSVGGQSGMYVGVDSQGGGRWHFLLRNIADTYVGKSTPWTPNLLNTTGAVAIDWARVANPETAVNLSATNIDTDQVVASVTGEVGSVTNRVTANADQIAGSGAAATLLAALYAAAENGTAQAGGASSITLRAGASAVNDSFAAQAVWILSGTGANQTNRITAYNGTTKVATVATAWVTVPDNTSVYVVIGRIE